MLFAAAIAAAVTVAAPTHMTYGGIERTFRVHRPAGLGRERAVPLVVMLHGGFGTGAQAERSYGWDAAADRHGFVVVYPDGVRRSWNAGSCCGAALRNSVDDVGFLSTVIERVTAQEHIDRTRIAITGISNGAMMAYRMACDATLSLRAIGSVAGSMVTPCSHPQRTSVMEIHGLADHTLPFAGGKGEGPSGVITPPVRDVVNRWRVIDGCGAPRVATTNGVTTEASACADRRSVTLETIAGAGHQWPGGVPPPPGLVAMTHALGIWGIDTPSNALDATEALYHFFFEGSSTRSS
jgi:polyhydroxybutyrate depolymerase